LITLFCIDRRSLDIVSNTGICLIGDLEGFGGFGEEEELQITTTTMRGVLCEQVAYKLELIVSLKGFLCFIPILFLAAPILLPLYSLRKLPWNGFGSAVEQAYWTYSPYYDYDEKSPLTSYSSLPPVNNPSGKPSNRPQFRT